MREKDPDPPRKRCVIMGESLIVALLLAGTGPFVAKNARSALQCRQTIVPENVDAP